MGRRKDFLDEYDSDSSSDGSDADDIVPTDDGGHRSKRRRTTQANAREAAALGVFGSDDDDRGGRGGGGWKGKNLRARGMGFVGAGEKVDDDDEEEVTGLRGRIGGGLGFQKAQDPMEEEEEEDGSFQEPYPEEEEEWDEPMEEQRPRLGLGGGRMAFSKINKATPKASSATPSGASTPHAHPGLGFGGAATPTATTPAPSTPSFASPFGTGFISSAAKSNAEMPKMSAMPPPNGETPVVRPSAFGTPAARKGKKPAADTPPTTNPDSFAARMMAKMGYKAGQGLGKAGQGRLEPVAPKVRPQGVGVGAVREMSEQEKAESRRTRALKGEVLSDSDSEKERKARRKKRQSAGGVSTPGGTPRARKEKKKFRTAAEIAAEVQGLEVPSALKNIIDFTGKEQKLLTSAHGLLQPGREDPENLKLAKMARADLESFAAEWKALQERKAYLAAEDARLEAVAAEQKAEIERMQELVALSQSLQSLSLEHTPAGLEALVAQLEVLQHQRDLPADAAAELAIAALAPPFKTHMATWNALTHPHDFANEFLRLATLLGIRTRAHLEAEYTQSGFIARSKLASPYESLLATHWLPRVRRALSSWNALDPAPATALLDLWAPVLPHWIHAAVIAQLVLPKLQATLQHWTPSSRARKRQPVPLHVWLHPWLPHLSPHLPLLLPSIKSKLAAQLRSHPIAAPPPTDLPLWSPLVPTEPLILRHLLPRLAEHLHTFLTINPADQSLTALEAVLAYAPLLPPPVLGKLLAAEFFPKWLAVLHQWLTTPGANLDEVRQWYLFWTDVLPAAPGVREGFASGLAMVNDALDLGERAAAELPLPAAHPVRIVPKATDTAKSADSGRDGKGSGKQQAQVAETTFRDVVEDWCAEHELLLVPLRRADVASGMPLFRITASASGKGGVVCYMKGDVVWVLRKRRRGVDAGEGGKTEGGEGEEKKEGGQGGGQAVEKEVWEPVGLEEVGRMCHGGP